MSEEGKSVEVALVTATNTQISAQMTEQNSMLDQATVWVKSGLLPSSVKTPEQAVVIALKGKELNLTPMASFELIDVIMGKPALKPKGMAGMVRKGGVRYMETIIRFYRDGLEEDVKYTYRDAQALGLTSKDNWKKQPGIMMYWRCFSKGANRVCPDLIGGLYTTEELASFTANAPTIQLTEDGESVVIG